MRIPHGPPAIIWTDPPNPRGATWGPDGDILIAGRGVQDNKGQLWLIPAAGGPARVLDFSDMKGGWFFEPAFLPQGGNFLFRGRVKGIGVFGQLHSDLDGLVVFVKEETDFLQFYQPCLRGARQTVGSLFRHRVLPSDVRYLHR